jgi:hypothetical protein
MAEEAVEAKRLLDRHRQMKSDRHQWESHWQDIADFVVPDRQFTVTRSPGQALRNHIYDSTAPFANERLASALNGLLTNPALLWFELGVFAAVDEDVMSQRWLDSVRMSMLQIMNNPRMRFYTSLNEIYQDIAAFGTGVLFMRTTAEGVMYQSVPLGDCYIDEDAEGNINRLHRELIWTARQSAGILGPDTPEEITEMLRNDKGGRKLNFVQAVFEREEFDATRADRFNKPWASQMLWTDKPMIVRTGGFDEFPFAVARWSKGPGEIYGRGPAMKVLAEIKMLNAMSQTIIEAAQKVADPPVQMPDDGFMGPLAMHPGGINYYRSQGLETDRITPIVTGARPDIGLDMIERRQQIVREAHYLDIFQLPELDRMTATEVVARRNDKMQLLSPVLSRLFQELLDPIITRTFNIIKQLVPDPPAAIGGRRLRISYTSPLALSQKSSESVNIQQYLNYLLPVAQTDPTVMENIDNDAYARAGVGIFNVPGRIVRTPEDVAQRRQEREEAAAAAAAAATAADAATAATRGADALATVGQNLGI